MTRKLKWLVTFDIKAWWKSFVDDIFNCNLIHDWLAQYVAVLDLLA